jgi:hypothetical protein
MRIAEEWQQRKLPPLDHLIAAGGNVTDMTILS